MSSGGELYAPITDSVAADDHLVAAKRLQALCASFFVPAALPHPRGLVLMLHGYSAGPWQFAELAQAASQAGLHAYAARLPGHGAQRSDGAEDAGELPKSGQMALYGDCAEAAFARAHAVAAAAGVPLHLFGFSTGGALALDLATRHAAEVSRLVLIAPLLQPRGLRPRLIFGALRVLRALRLAGWLDRRPYSWGPRPLLPPDGWTRPGHWDFWLGNLFAVLAYARAVQRRCRVLRAPTQLIVTDSDGMCDPRAALRLLRQGSHTNFVLRFPAARGVPHAMLTAHENPDAEARATIAAVVCRFLLEGHGQDSP